MPKLNEKQLLGVTIGIFVLLIGGVGFADWWMWEKDHKVKVEKQNTLKGEIKQLEGKKSELDKFKLELEELKKKEEEYVKILPAPNQVTRGQFVSMLKDFEIEAGVQVTDITEVQQQLGGAVPPGGAAKPGAKAPFETVEFKFTVKGGFYEVVHFMHKIENHERLMKIVDGDITPETSTVRVAPGQEDEAASKKTLVTLNIKVATYVYSQPMGPAAGGS